MRKIGMVEAVYVTVRLARTGHRDELTTQATYFTGDPDTVAVVYEAQKLVEKAVKEAINACPTCGRPR